MPRQPRILFICCPDSTHAQSWIDLLRASEFDVRVFSVYQITADDRYLPAWQFPTYTVSSPPKRTNINNRVISLLPKLPGTNGFLQLTAERLKLRERWLKRVLSSWKPDIVHSFPLTTGGKPTVQVLQAERKEKWPKWVASSWGSDLYMGLEGEFQERDNLDFILRNCDGFFSDCGRDLELANRNGLCRKSLVFADTFPGTGGLDLELFAKIRTGSKKRDVILVPKAYEREHANRVFPFLEALTFLADDLKNYQVHLLMCSDAVKKWLRKLPKSIQQICRPEPMLSQEKLFALLARTRVMVALSLSDGTPNVMLEAMAAGALSVMSPLDSVQEWIEDGKNGLLTHALYPEKIAAALKRALSDDTLFENAQKMNWDIISSRANRSAVREKVLKLYERLLNV